MTFPLVRWKDDKLTVSPEEPQGGGGMASTTLAFKSNKKRTVIQTKTDKRPWNSPQSHPDHIGVTPERIRRDIANEVIRRSW